MTRRIAISADLEGIAGVCASEELRPGNPEFQWARQAMTGEVNAAIQGARTAIPNAEIVVIDGHGTYRNLIVDQLDPTVELVRGRPPGLRHSPRHNLLASGPAGSVAELQTHPLVGRGAPRLLAHVADWARNDPL